MEDASGLSIEVQTRDGLKEGKLLFKEFVKHFKDAPTFNGTVLSIGVLEGGTTKGLPSVIMLVQMDSVDEKGNPGKILCCAELTGQNFLIGSQMANEHISRFLRQCNTEVNLGGML